MKEAANRGSLFISERWPFEVAVPALASPGDFFVRIYRRLRRSMSGIAPPF
jgi:hypothetical protein